MKKITLKHINFFILLYAVLLIALYNISNANPINYLFTEIFKEDISFLIKNKPEKIMQYIILFDKSFFILSLLSLFLFTFYLEFINLKI